ncbi:MAG TPA: hypothetical protein VFB60_23915 [Ktedonobacteraceae bacterium]|nr:hypothetical protein [Ktedonobacteraceae bacterium]
MNKWEDTCLLSQRQLVDEYFIEMRAKLLDVAAFLDRLDRSVERNAEEDFRMVAMQLALRMLSEAASDRVYSLQMLFSDATTEPLAKLDQKSAFGAFNNRRSEG